MKPTHIMSSLKVQTGLCTTKTKHKEYFVMNFLQYFSSSDVL